MTMNLSSSNDSLLHPNYPSEMYCLFNRLMLLNIITFTITKMLLLLPLCVLVIQRQQCSTSTAAMTSHSDTFTYHMVIMELVGLLGCIFACCGVYIKNENIFSLGDPLLSHAWYGETFFHILTCVEHYLAVVHPVTYLSLRGERGVRIRNISIGCVWLLCLGAACLTIIEDIFLLLNFCLMLFSLISISFCSLSVLRVLIRPGPGEQGGDRERVDQSKRRAFYTIMAILGVLLLRCLANLALIVVYVLKGVLCITDIAELWVNFPGSLVLPLLFLHKAGKLVCCKNNT